MQTPYDKGLLLVKIKRKIEICNRNHLKRIQVNPELGVGLTNFTFKS